MSTYAQRLRYRLSRPGAPVATYAIIALCVLAYAIQVVWPGFTDLMLFYPAYVAGEPSISTLTTTEYLPNWALTGGFEFEPWRVLTYGFVHSTSSFIPWHLLLNMYTLWVFGMVLEPAIGRARYITVYLFGLAGGALGAFILSPNSAVVGASGALFALMGAVLVIQRRAGGQIGQLVVLLAINLVYGFSVGGVSWQAHLGGLIIGLLSGVILAETRAPKDRGLQKVYFAILGLVVVGLFYLTPAIMWYR
ncbi:rhomboid family intramembrane serine protease [Pseudoclavibacter soli]|uniref:rhomboid family intramembrane serine protease n=1 Tax=Pseudoclavibacter soli TaxID=452623 RepID=UPI0004071399|nr:rhomboid family intramembrane serine protease [Pseudoclavibacter soli]